MPVSVPPPIAATFRVLTSSDAVQVPMVLVAALDVPCEPVQYAAAEAILERTSEHDHFELLQRLPKLPKSVVGLAAARLNVLQPAFKQALLHGSEETRRLAFAAIAATGFTTPLPYVLELVRQPHLPDAERASETLRDLVSRLYDRSHSATERAALRSTRDQVLNDLAHAIDQIGDGHVPEAIAAGMLILGDPGHAAVHRALWQGRPAIRETMQRLIHESRHPGVLRFIMASLQEKYPHPHAFAALRQRTDLEFMTALLRACGSALPRYLQENLGQIEALQCFDPPLDRLAAVPAPMQPAIVTLVQATRLPREQKAAVLEWLLRHGTPGAKLAATHGLSLLDQGMAQDVVRENLEADDPAVQAWATSQLRHTALPDAYALLIERLESPLPEVQAAARRELSGFSVERVMEMADDFSSEEARRAGRLLLKVSPDATAQLRHELQHPARQKRMRAARRILKLGLQNELADVLIRFAEDGEPQMRRTAAEVLEHISTPVAEQALLELLNDTHPRVREAAAEALRRGHAEAMVPV